MRIDNFDFAQASVDVRDEYPPAIVQEVDNVARYQMAIMADKGQEVVIKPCAGRIELGGKIDSDGKGAVEGKVVIDF